MKTKLKKLVILLSLMVLTGNLFGDVVIRSPRIGQYGVSVEYTGVTKHYYVCVYDTSSHIIYMTGAFKEKSEAMYMYQGMCSLTAPYIKEFLDGFSWQFNSKQNGWPMYTPSIEN